MGPPDDQAVERLIGERGQHLIRAAVALTGSRTDGEDLLQAALERLLQNWSRVDSDPEGVQVRLRRPRLAILHLRVTIQNDSAVPGTTARPRAVVVCDQEKSSPSGASTPVEVS
jgi:hypothetical protein